VAPVDYEVEYNNRARVPENPGLIAGWARDAAAYRAHHAPRAMSCGSGARNVMDFFAGGAGGLATRFGTVPGCAAGRSGFADGVAPEGTGGALKGTA
jgi:hypothetical protein